MGQKIHPIGLRLGINRTWSSRWYADTKNYPALVLEDTKVREYIKKKLFAAGISKIDIERKSDQVEVAVHTAKPGIIVGRGGQGIDQLRKDVQTLTNKKVQINVIEVLPGAEPTADQPQRRERRDDRGGPRGPRGPRPERQTESKESAE